MIFHHPHQEGEVYKRLTDKQQAREEAGLVFEQIGFPEGHETLKAFEKLNNRLEEAPGSWKDSPRFRIPGDPIKDFHHHPLLLFIRSCRIIYRNLTIRMNSVMDHPHYVNNGEINYLT